MNPKLFKDAIIGGVKIGIIAFTSVIVIDNLGFKINFKDIRTPLHKQPLPLNNPIK